MKLKLKIKIIILLSAILCVSMALGITVFADNVDSSLANSYLYLSDLTPKQSVFEYPTNMDKASDGQQLSVANKTYEKGIGMCSMSGAVDNYSYVTFDLSNYNYKYFYAVIGINDSQALAGSAIGIVKADDVELYRSQVISKGTKDVIVVDIQGAKTLTLMVSNADEYVYFDALSWCEAMLFNDINACAQVKVEPQYNELSTAKDNYLLSGSYIGCEKIDVVANNKLCGEATLSNGEWSILIGNLKEGTNAVTIRAYKNGSITAMNKISINKYSVPDNIAYLSDLHYLELKTQMPFAQDISLDEELAQIGSKVYDKCLVMHSNQDPANHTTVTYEVDSSKFGYVYFECGLDNKEDADSGTLNAAARIVLLGDDQVVYTSEILTRGLEPIVVCIPIESYNTITFKVDACGEYSGDWVVLGNVAFVKDYSMCPRPTITIDGASTKYFEGNAISLTGSAFSGNIVKAYLGNQLLAETTYDLANNSWQLDFNLPQGKSLLTLNLYKSGSNEIIAQTQCSIVVNGDSSAVVTKTLATQTTEVGIALYEDNLVVTSVKDTATRTEWLKSISPVPMMDYVYAGNAIQAVTWKYSSYSTKTIDDYVEHIFSFTCNEINGLVTQCIWTEFPTYIGAIRYRQTIKNNSTAKITVPCVETLNLELISKAPVEAMHILKSNSIADYVGTDISKIDGNTRLNIQDGTHTYINGSTAGYIPWINVSDGANGIMAGIEWTHCNLELVGGATNGSSQEFTLSGGLLDDFKTDIPVGVEYKIPQGFICAYNGNYDDSANMLRKWLYKYNQSGNLVDKDRLINRNLCWATGDVYRSWVITNDYLYQNIDDVAEYGYKRITIDIGWWATEGDFFSFNERIPQGIETVIEYAHSKGLEVALYFRFWNGDSESDTALSRLNHPEWFTDEGHLDFGNKEAVDYIIDIVSACYEKYKFDVFRSDFWMMVAKSDRTGNRHAYGVDTLYWNTVGYYDFIDTMIAKYPNFVWENCSIGGVYKDFYSVNRSYQFQTQDTDSTGSIRASVYDSTYIYPVSQIYSLLFYYGNAQSYEGRDYDYCRRSALMLGMASCDQLNANTDPDDIRAMLRCKEIYEEWVMPILTTTDVYHILPRPNEVDWDGLFYFDKPSGKGIATIFKGTTTETEKIIKLDGLESDKQYYVWSEDGTIPFVTYTGKQLMETGLLFKFDLGFDSDVLFVVDCQTDFDVSVPTDFDVIIDGNNVQIANCQRANDYIVDLYCENTLVDSFISKDGALQLVGLDESKEYFVKVTARNQFGKNESSTKYAVNSAIESFSGFAGENLQTIRVGDTIYLNASEMQFAQNTVSQVEQREYVIDTTDVAIVSGSFALDDINVFTNVEFVIEDASGNQLYIGNITKDTPKLDYMVETCGSPSLKLIVTNKTGLVMKQLFRYTYKEGGDNAYLLASYLGNLSTDYEFSADGVEILRGNEGMILDYGIYAAYVNASEYVRLVIDSYSRRLDLKVVKDGKETITTIYKLGDEYVIGKPYRFYVKRQGNNFAFGFEGEIIYQTTLDIGASQVGVVTLDERVLYGNIKLIQNGQNVEGVAFGNSESGTAVRGDWQTYSPNVVLVTKLYKDSDQYKTNLQEIVEKARKLNAQNFTAQSFEQLSQKLATAEEVLANANAQIEQIQDATAQLNNSILLLQEQLPIIDNTPQGLQGWQLALVIGIPSLLVLCAVALLIIKKIKR